MYKIILLFCLNMISSVYASDDFDTIPFTIEEGIEYEKLHSIGSQKDLSGKIEVIEFFSYGCIHCFQFENHIQEWLKHKPENVIFKKVPVMTSKRWEYFGKLYYLFEQLSIEKEMTPVLFSLIHEKKFSDPLDDLYTVLLENGFVKKKVDSVVNSFGVSMKVRKAKSLAGYYKIDSVPNVIINGQYKTNAVMAHGHKGTIKVIEYLIDKISKNKK